ncbi:sensor histidine kinase [Nonomuraea sp. NPDC050310]|uniref:sensor histidine kinase n=1 Tax=unclassified Nonomuraea TaxID=2593643 RepID=UPI0033D08DF2
MNIPRRAWLDTAHVVTGFAVGLLLGTLALLTVLVPRLATRAVPWLTRVQRSRFRAFLGVEIPTAEVVSRRRDGHYWRQFGYHVLSPFFSMATGLLICFCWGAAVVGLFGFLHQWLQPAPWIFPINLRDPAIAAAYTGSGVVLLVLGGVLARAMASLDLAIARGLLGPSHTELGQRIETLTESRAGVVDAADAERRRIERDLHDGAQQRLVSLAMNLGMARATLTDLPDPARDAIDQAHEEAKQALKELRDLVRGLHPAVLNDQGLDAALSGIAARAPVPVRLRVDLPVRLSPTIEAVAFFVVSEALANVAKHARATAVEITVRLDRQLLHVSVYDDGRGGATLDSGTGLRGLRQRVHAVDGTFLLTSPVGGPTMITVELPV